MPKNESTHSDFVDTFRGCPSPRYFQNWLASGVQLTADGFQPYLEAVETNFEMDEDYALLVNTYGSEEQESSGPEWHGPAKVVAAMPVSITGKPDMRCVSTSYIERQNLTMRMQMRRFARLTNASSKKLANLRAAVALYFAHYNFCRVHSTLKVTPATGARIFPHDLVVSAICEPNNHRSRAVPRRHQVLPKFPVSGLVGQTRQAGFGHRSQGHQEL